MSMMEDMISSSTTIYTFPSVILKYFLITSATMSVPPVLPPTKNVKAIPAPLMAPPINALRKSSCIGLIHTPSKSFRNNEAIRIA